MFKLGDQIAYIPLHAGGKIDHPDVEFGFVISQTERGVFCRYWTKGKPGELRTRANSELTNETDLVKHASVDQSVVEGWLRRIINKDV